jgi:hypothetical protein
MGHLNQHSTYEKDFYAWAIENAELLRQKKFEEIDIEHIAEEIESMGKNDKRGIISHLRVLIAHLLKWQYQPEFRTNSWKSTIRNARYQIRALLEDSPSLKREIHLKLDRAYKDALNIASDETGMAEEAFPKHCTFSLEQCLHNEFFPD